MNIRKKWNNHLLENNMSYWQHLKFAVFFSIQCLIAAIQLFIHSIFPCWFQKAGSNLVGLLKKSFHNTDSCD
jgi:hypothetical protein